MRIRFLTVVAALACALCSPSLALSPHEVLVVYNSRELPAPTSPDYATACQVIPASRRVAEYYASARGIPSRNLLGLPQAQFTEYCSENQYLAALATPIENYLSQPENA